MIVALIINKSLLYELKGNCKLVHQIHEHDKWCCVKDYDLAVAVGIRCENRDDCVVVGRVVYKEK
jgi:hypothetical protein